MCGIVGVFPVPSETTLVSPEVQKALALWFHNEVLYHTVKRGKDATGMVATFGAHEDAEKYPEPYFWACLKQPVDVDDFFKNDGTDKKYAGQKKQANIHALMDKFSSLKRPLLHVIGHTRAKTIGSELNPNNNHPILVNNIIGVHNGGVKNYERIYEKHKIKGQGDVDSEAIMQLLNEVAPDRALTLDDAAYVTERIEGPRAVMAFNNKYPENIIFFKDAERPLEMSFLGHLGLVVLYSEREFLKSALSSYERMRLIGKKTFGEAVFPKINEYQGYLTAGEGGIIDINKPFATGTLKEYLEVKKLPDTIHEYKNISKTTGPYNQGNSHTTTTTPATVEAEVIDDSKYDDPKAVTVEASEDAGTSGESVTVSSKEVMDDPEEVTAEVTMLVSDDGPEDPTGMADLVAEDEEEADEDEEIDQQQTMYLRQMAEEIYFKDPDFLKDPRIVLNRMKGNLASLINKQEIDEDEAGEIIQMLYPEAFTDGYIFGYTAGEENTQEETSDELEKMEKAKEALELENDNLKKVLAARDQSLLEAAKVMANLKGFLIASLMIKNNVGVDAKTGDVVFDEEIEEFLEMESNVFNKVNLENVRTLFSRKEKRMISEGLLAQTRNKNTRTA